MHCAYVFAKCVIRTNASYYCYYSIWFKTQSNKRAMEAQADRYDIKVRICVVCAHLFITHLLDCGFSVNKMLNLCFTNTHLHLFRKTKLLRDRLRK